MVYSIECSSKRTDTKSALASWGENPSECVSVIQDEPDYCVLTYRLWKRNSFYLVKCVAIKGIEQFWGIMTVQEFYDKKCWEHRFLMYFSSFNGEINLWNKTRFSWLFTLQLEKLSELCNCNLAGNFYDKECYEYRFLNGFFKILLWKSTLEMKQEFVKIYVAN